MRGVCKGFIGRLEIDEREALSWNSFLLKIFHLGEKGDLKKNKKTEEKKKAPPLELQNPSKFDVFSKNDKMVNCCNSTG